MNLDTLTDLSENVVVKLTGPNSMSSPGHRTEPVFNARPTSWTVTVRECVDGSWHTHVLGRVRQNPKGRYEAEVDGVTVSDHTTHRAALTALRRHYYKESIRD